MRSARGARPHRRDHSQQPRSATTSTNSAHSAGGAKNSIATRTTRMTTAVATRVASTSGSARLRHRLAFAQLLARPSEAPFALAVRRDGGIERLGAEIGPERVGEEELGVGELPEDAIGD